MDLLAPEDALVGHRLIKPKVQISILRLKTELGEAGNVPALKKVYEVIERAKAYTGSAAREGLTIQVTGSAAVGAETQRASDDAIRYTEVFTVLLVLLILAVVYRAPMLVSVPVVSIGIAVVIATGVIAWTIVGGRATGIPHPEVFVTSRIFVFVIVFGAGTDFCLFLIARLREEAGSADWNTAVSNSLSKTFGALVGSAMTTIVGLSTMILATFGKFYHTGPVISICLSITLLTCLTFTPALLRWMGPRVFWPSKPGAQHSGERLWVFVAQIVTRYPGTVLLFGSIGMLVPAVYGWQRQHAVTYDFVSQLSPSAPSRQAAELLATEFPAGETNPISVVVLAPQTSDKKQLQENIRALTAKLYVPGVSSVRSLVDPLGDTPPGQRVGVLARQDWRRRTLQNHAVARSYFISGEPEYAGRVARFDVIPLGDPFGTQAADTLDNLRKRMEEQVARADSGWFNASFAFSGTTASIQDLRSVTMKDTTEIQISVLIAVLIVLLFVVRRVWLSIYLIITVLVSYFATLGMTLLFFSWTGGDSFVGLDWKLPLFLFVILVAVGQDYNVYLVTRVLEEVKGGNRQAGLRRAVARTGGIITSCGVVMAGTFFSMTSAAWAPPLLEMFGLSDSLNRPPTLASITQLGFSLGLGVLLDTFYVRPILVPAYMALVDKWFGQKRSGGQPASEE